MIDTIELFTLGAYSCPILGSGLFKVNKLFSCLALGFKLKLIALLPYIDKLKFAFEAFTDMLPRVWAIGEGFEQGMNITRPSGVNFIRKV